MGQDLRWRFAAGAPDTALAPAPACLPFGEQPPSSPFRQRSFTGRWRAVEHGYRTRPGDCPPVRALSRYGFVARCPGAVRLRRRAAPLGERLIEPGRAAFGLADLEGAPWPGSDSGLVASWILGSEFVKVHTGLEILFPRDCWLFQGPLPNQSPGAGIPEVMAGVEPSSDARTLVLDGEPWTVTPLTIIVRLPATDRLVEIDQGQELVWFFAVPPGGAWRLAPTTEPVR